MACPTIDAHGATHPNRSNGSHLQLGAGRLKLVQKNGQAFRTIADAAKDLGVSAKTVRDWVVRGIIPEPPMIEQGVRTLRHFPHQYMQRARLALARYRARKMAETAKTVRHSSA